MSKEFKPIIKVVAFKPSGKYYTEAKVALKPEHSDIHGFELTDLIRRNDTSIRSYCPVTSGFLGEMTFVIEVDYGPKQDFCYFLLKGAAHV